MRNLKIPRTDIFFAGPGNRKSSSPPAFTTEVLNRRCSGCARSVRSIRLIHGFRRQDSLNRQHLGCEKSSTKTSRHEPEISRAAKPPRRLPTGLVVSNLWPCKIGRIGTVRSIVKCCASFPLSKAWKHPHVLGADLNRSEIGASRRGGELAIALFLGSVSECLPVLPQQPT